MARVRYTSQQRAEAVALIAEHGIAEAARRTGIPTGTVASWGHRAGVSSPSVEATERMVAGRQVEWEKRKVELGHRIGKAAAMALTRIEERLEDDHTGSMRDIAATLAILVDKAQLLTGGATERTEIIEGEEQEQAIATVRELRNVA